MLEFMEEEWEDGKEEPDQARLSQIKVSMKMIPASLAYSQKMKVAGAPE